MKELITALLKRESGVFEQLIEDQESAEPVSPGPYTGLLQA